VAYIKPVIFSLVLSILSLAIVAFFPLNITLITSGPIYSPYHNEIEALRVKTTNGLHPSAPEWKILDDLIMKNEEWFEAEKNKLMRSDPTIIHFEAWWEKKGEYLSPVVMIVWGAAFYIFFNNKSDYKNLMVLIFPIIFAIAQLMPVLEVLLISFIILTIYFWFLTREKYGYKHGP